MPRKTMGIQHWVTLLATVFVVGGIVAIVQLRPGNMPEAGMVANEAVLSGRVVVFGEEGTVHVIDAETGAELQECAVAGATRLFEVTPEGMVIGLPSGDRIRMGFDCIAGEEPVRGITIADDVLTFADGTAVELVAANGRPFREAQLIDWMDHTHVALVAFRGDVREALAVGTDGSLAELVTLPEFVDGFGAANGAFWYVTATPGPGIEFGPRGPSAIHRVGLEGEDVVMAEDAASVVEAFSAGPDGSYAYIVGGTLFLGKEGEAVNAGTGIPVGWSGDNRALVIDQRGRLSLKAADGSVAETAVVLPQSVVQAWSVIVDAPAQTE